MHLNVYRLVLALMFSSAFFSKIALAFDITMLQEQIASQCLTSKIVKEEEKTKIKSNHKDYAKNFVKLDFHKIENKSELNDQNNISLESKDCLTFSNELKPGQVK